MDKERHDRNNHSNTVQHSWSDAGNKIQTIKDEKRDKKMKGATMETLISILVSIATVLFVIKFMR